MSTYIHYGNKKFDKWLFFQVKNRPGNNKPSGGLWASPTDAAYGWSQWNEVEEYAICDKENAFVFSLLPEANVLHMRTVEDVKSLPRLNDNGIDFEKMKEDGIDAIEVHISECPKLYDELYGWDCDSILVMNEQVIKEETL